ncbi:hypothetical protein H6G11_07885 [Cyanobacterium aponinum FACHB-4101]|uniref:hypothetical protein n=1 Tax=Cyanobacterium aponinum TaxID=379064 RepID=UPI001680FD51|nr:hypothetical protein [Cyanobacterium aponinum]MBD2394178.1 hypothetical protein [Cyanobacterium aponinum FACHB-4101]
MNNIIANRKQNSNQIFNSKNKKERIYLGFCYQGKPSEVIEIISQKVNEYDLTKLIPLLRVEKKDKTKMGKRKKPEFYFFVAIEKGNDTQSERMYQEFQEKLLVLKYFKRNAFKSKGLSIFTHEQIKDMVAGKTYDVLDYTNPIPYETKSKENLVNDNPFEVDNISDNLSTDNNSKNYQKLLYWLSVVGSSSWQLFRKTCQILQLDNPARNLRKLKLLGHLETSADGQKIVVNSLTLVQIESNTEEKEFILCGQQNGKLINNLEKFGTVKIIEQPQKNAPSCIKFIPDNDIQLQEIIEQIKNNYYLQIYQAGLVSRKLADALPHWQEWYENLSSLQGIVTSLYEWRQFYGNIFVECLTPQKTGMYQMFQGTIKNSGDNLDLSSQKPIRTVFYDADTQCFKQGDWCGLRFLAMKAIQQEIVIKYDEISKRLAIPYTQRLPQLYERSLVLASGILPSYQKTEDKNIWLIYENISLNLLQTLANKLDLNWEEKRECMM